MGRDSRVDVARIGFGVVVIVAAAIAVAFTNPGNLGLWGVVGAGVVLLVVAVLAAGHSRSRAGD